MASTSSVQSLLEQNSARVHRNPLNNIVIADLQTRLAVLETELRHAKQDKEDALLGTRALLGLLRTTSINSSTQMGMGPVAGVDGDAAKLKRKYDRVSEECAQLRDRLHRKSARLQSMRCHVRSADVRNWKRFLTSATTDQLQYSAENMSHDAADTTNRNSTHVNVNMQEDDLIDGDHAVLHVAPASDDLEEPASFNVKLEDAVEYESLDDFDTAADWRVQGRVDADGKPEIIHHFDHKRPLPTASLGRRITPEGEAKNAEHDTQFRAVDADMNKSKRYARASDDNDLESQQDAGAALQKQLHAVTQIALQPGPPSKMFRLLPTDPSQDYRMISISGLSNDITLARVLLHVAGGAVVCATLSRDSTLTNMTTAYITFFHNASAAAYVNFYASEPLVIGKDEVKVELIKAAVIPVALEQMRTDFCTRCISISSSQTTLTVEKVKDDLFIIDARIRDCIVTAWKDGEHSSGILHIHFVSVDAAMAARKYLSHATRYRDCDINFAPDPCARRLEPIKRRDSAIVAKSAQMQALNSGSYRRQLDVNTGRRGTPTCPARRPYHAYTSHDVVNKQENVDLSYDDGEDSEMITPDANTSNQELDHGMLMKVSTRFENASPPAISQASASRTSRFSLLDAAQLEGNDRPALANEDTNDGEIPATMVAQSDIAHDEDLTSALPKSSQETVSPEPTAPGILALAQALMPIPEPDWPRSPRNRSSPVALSASSSTLSAAARSESTGGCSRKLTGPEQSKHATTSSPTKPSSPSGDPILRLPSPPSFGFKFSMPHKPANSTANQQERYSPKSSLPLKHIAKSANVQRRSMQTVPSFHARGRPLLNYDDLYDERPEKRARASNEQQHEMIVSSGQPVGQPEDGKEIPRIERQA